MMPDLSPLELAIDLYSQGRFALAALPVLQELAGRSVCIVGGTGQIGSVLTETLQLANSARSSRTLYESQASHELLQTNTQKE